MDLDRLSAGEKIAGVSAVVLFAFMFLDWFGVKVSGQGGSTTLPGGGSAWDSLDFIPIVLVVTIVIALINVAIRLGDSAQDPPVPLNTAVAVLGVISCLLILFRIIDPPSFGEISGLSVDGTLELGIFLSLLAAAGIAIGGYLGMQEERESFGDAADHFSSGPPGQP